MYDFKTQLHQGEKFENELDNIFSLDYNIQEATNGQQRQGIDRIFTHKADGNVYLVEYKSDLKASSTGNAFVETTSVDTANKLGWAYTSQADYLIYYLPEDGLIYVIDFDDLRCRLPKWKRFPSRRIPNRGYKTVGLLVPLNEFEDIAKQVISH